MLEREMEAMVEGIDAELEKARNAKPQNHKVMRVLDRLILDCRRAVRALKEASE